jgi:glycosyltransferase involved in cell wall biosynthesis
MNTAAPPVVSIVTPVYNGAEYLSECIESVLAQTYTHWEYIIVDNCSVDGSAEIARQYAAKDRRIRLHENSQFLRALPNHNAALQQISPSSKYCKIVFADDWVFPECLERMVALAEEYPSVGIVGAYVLEGRNIICTGLPYPSSFVNGREICRRHLLEGLYVFGSPNAVLYRSSLVRCRNQFFNEANVHADTEVCFSLLKDSDFGFVHQVLTFTRVRPGSRTAASDEMQTCYAGMLQILLTAGREYLSHAELEKLLRKHLSEYYKFLGKSFLFHRNKTIDYHRKKLTEAGIGFSWGRVLLGALQTLAGLGLNPKGVIEKLSKPKNAVNLAEPQKKHTRAPAPIPDSGDTLE